MYSPAQEGDPAKAKATRRNLIFFMSYLLARVDVVTVLIREHQIQAFAVLVVMQVIMLTERHLLAKSLVDLNCRRAAVRYRPAIMVSRTS